MLDSEKQKQVVQSSLEKTFPDKTAFLGPSIDMHAELRGNEDLIIEGKFRGKIDIQDNNLFIEKDAEVDADIRARDITVKGKVKGNIHASGKVYIMREARMFGDISATRISIMEGAQFKGSMKMVSRMQQE